MESLKNLFQWLRKWVSPVYIAMLFAAFVLWYITKLGDSYTTDHEVTVVIDGTEYNVDCTIRGKGTDLIHYTISSSRSRFTIPMNDLTLDNPMEDESGVSYAHVTAESMKLALASRMDNIDVISVGKMPKVHVGSETSKNVCSLPDDSKQ
jgi:hypothetical protein